MTGTPVLIDVTERGTVRPWAERKRQSLAVAEAFLAQGPTGIGRHERLTRCGAFLEFEGLLQPATGERRKRRIKSSFCKERLCPNCQWRRSLTLYGQLSEAVESHLEDYPHDRLLLLTLTAANCSAAELGASLTRLTTGFRRMSERAGFKRAVRGWFRSLEVTRPTRGEYHPHLHILLVVPPAYFDPARDLYLTTREWAQAWRQALRVPYTPICYAQAIGERGAACKGLAEVAKYCVKPGDWLTFERGPAARWRADPQTVRELAAGLRGKRLVGWGGALRDIHDARKIDDYDDHDPDVIGWRDLPPGWVVEGREAYNFWGPDDVSGEFFLMRRFNSRTAVQPARTC